MYSADVSVIIPCFNCKNTIVRALKSVLDQTLIPQEILIIDDGSNDGTLEYLQLFIKKYEGSVSIKLKELKKNSGASRARNIGWDLSSSTYVAFLDADDTWHPEKIEIQFNFMKKHFFVDVCGHFSSTTEKNVSFQNNRRNYSLLFLHHFLIKNRFSTPSVMLRKDLPFRFNEQLRYAEDYSLWIDVASSEHCIALIPAHLCFLHKARYGESGLSSHLFKMWRGEAAAFFRLWRNNSLPLFLSSFFVVFSFCKYIKRVIVVMLRFRPFTVLPL